MTKSMRFSKLMQHMGMMDEAEPVREIKGTRKPMSPERSEALTGVEGSELEEKRRMKAILDSKIAQLEVSDDPQAIESLNYWKEKRKELGFE